MQEAAELTIILEIEMNYKIKNIIKRQPFIIKLIFCCIIFIFCFMILIAVAMMLVPSRLHIGEFKYSVDETETMVPGKVVLDGLDNSLQSANLEPSQWIISSDSQQIKTNLFSKTNFNDIYIDLTNQINSRLISVRCNLISSNILVYDLNYGM
ncbi:MAG: hypothetical protein EOM12_07545 [Verrucomicrobiae bacterium]|nr:hypothetical protein [Verrucomicrobiae bacterium]